MQTYVNIAPHNTCISCFTIEPFYFVLVHDQLSVTAGSDFAIRGVLCIEQRFFLVGQTQHAWRSFCQEAAKPPAPEEDQVFVQSSWRDESTKPVDGVFHIRSMFFQRCVLTEADKQLPSYHEVFWP